MTTPRKNFNVLESPYAKHLPQYPSQSEGYLPFELGGPGSQNKGSDTQYNRRYTSTPAKCNNRSANSYRNNDGNGTGGDGNFYQNRQNHRGRGNNRYFGGRSSFYVDNAGASETSQQQRHQHLQHQQRYSGFGNRRGGGGGGGNSGGGPSGQQRFKNNSRDDIRSFFHPSMLEDPWRDLMERHNAIKNSRIDFQLQQEDRGNDDSNDSSAEAKNDGETEKEMEDDDDNEQGQEDAV